MHPTKKRGSPNTAGLNAWSKHLMQLLQAQVEMRSLHEVSKASGIPLLNYNKQKNNINRRIREAAAAVNHLRKLRYGK
ncbi:hypothetical protein [Yellowstone lake phycodnavirus 2]|uniref:hypothetical protein n=1 Tax=Yellowstone lake phycodnavirus 2 TaxID=1586714 RepID=UPI0006EB84E0|nr:hypothetical protein AR678_gp136 [Yellowstone lake phycodnavirus 2]BAT22410.1 hypothetical protein [Yellowstone lake phycodnavirus 2]